MMSPEFPVAVDQRILHRGQLLIEANLVFFEVFTPDKASLVVCFFGITLGVDASDLAAFDAVAPDVLEAGTRAVDEDHRLNDLLGRELSRSV